MINDTLKFLKEQLNAYLYLKTGTDDLVVFTDNIESGSITFEQNKITLLLINVEQDHSMRPANPYVAINEKGKEHPVSPEIRLNLLTLFVIKPSPNNDNPGSGYEQSTQFLSLIIQFFQTHRTFSQQDYPSMAPSIDHLVAELTALPLNQQNDIWNALRSTHMPSVLYKIKMAVFRDQEAIDMEKQISMTQIELNKN